MLSMQSIVILFIFINLTINIRQSYLLILFEIFSPEKRLLANNSSKTPKIKGFLPAYVVFAM
jgi:hypothetical protein